MRLLHIVGDSRFGGGSVVIGQLARRAVADHWQVDVLTTDPIFQSWLRTAGIGVVDLDVISREIRPVPDLRGLRRLYRFLKSEKYDLVHTHTSKAGLVGRLAAWMAGVPAIVHTVHGFAFHEFSSRASIAIFSTLERLAAHWCHRVITVSNYHREWALRIGIGNPAKVISIPNGIADVAVITSAERQRVRREIGVGDGDIMLISTGRLATQKGLQYLVDAVPTLRAIHGDRLKIVFAGDGPLREELVTRTRARGVQDQVLFLGFRTDVRSLAAAADIVVLPSLWEGLSISLLEAMAAGQPIVTTDIGSNVEATSNGHAAELVQPANSQAIVDAVTRLLGNPARRLQLAARARELFEAKFTEQQMLDAYSSQYAALMSQLRDSHRTLHDEVSGDAQTRARC